MPHFEFFPEAVWVVTLIHFAFVIWTPSRFRYQSLSKRVAASNWLLWIPFSIFEWVLSVSLLFFLVCVTFALFLQRPVIIRPELALAWLALLNTVLICIYRRKIHIAKLTGTPAVIRSTRQIAELHFLNSKRHSGNLSYTELIQESTKIDLLFALQKAGVISYHITSPLLNKPVFSNRLSAYLNNLVINQPINVKNIQKKSSLQVSAVIFGLRVIHRYSPTMLKKLAKKQSLIFLCSLARKLNQKGKKLWQRPVQSGFEIQFL